MSWSRVVSILLVVVAALALVSNGKAQQADQSKSTEKAPPLNDLEKQFADTLTGAVLEGSWQMASGEGLEGRAPLSEARTDRYEISQVQKVKDDQWLIGARVQYGDKDVVLPVPVRVVWAEDVPIITVDETFLPGLGRYAARVMIHRGYYSGIWHGTNYGGVMSGRVICADAPTTAPADQAEPKP